MAQTITATFEITGWDETRYDEPAEGPPLARATVRKRFSGPLEGTSVAEILTAQGEGGAGYLASERVDGSLDGRRGTFVIQHGGVGDAADQHAFGHIVPGSGTGGLTGLRGEAVYAHDEAGARVTIIYAFDATSGHSITGRPPTGSGHPSSRLRPARPAHSPASHAGRRRS